VSQAEAPVQVPAWVPALSVAVGPVGRVAEELPELAGTPVEEQAPDDVEGPELPEVEEHQKQV
jgi:hypothetical protein